MKIATRPKKIMRRQTCSLGGSFLCCYWLFKLCIVSASTDLPIDEEGSCDPSSLGDCLNTNLDTSKHGVEEKSNSCKLYMAPTTVGGIEGNYGMFTAVDLPKGATVLANDGPSIPFMLDARKEPSKIFPDVDHFGLFGNVWWNEHSKVSDQFRNGEINLADTDIVSVYDLQINFGALPNCHPYQSNIDSTLPTDGIDYDDRSYITGDHHEANPIRGSFSYYTGKRFYADKPVNAGMELFLDYASDWEQHGFPRHQDYYSAAALMRKWISAVHKAMTEITEENKEDTSPSAIYPIQEVISGARAMMTLIRMSSPELPLDWLGYNESDDHFKFDSYYEDRINAGIRELEVYTSRVLSVLPQNADDWDEVYKQSWEIYDRRISNIKEYSNEEESSALSLPSVVDVAEAMYEVSQPAPKSAQELQETGICLDHIVAGMSNVPLELGNRTTNDNMTIGRGAIAARFLAKGEMIVPVPFLHILDRALMEKKPPEEFVEDEMDFSEVLLNYCFGHSQSTLVMCPITNAVLINHCSDRNGRFPCGSVGERGKGPNAEYRWATESKWDTKTKDTLTMTLQDLADINYKQQHRMMSMEIVATRDIQEGEEIFIDYGEKWEEAWLEHVRNWFIYDENVNPSWSSPLTAFELNHGHLMETEDGKKREDPLFYGDLRSDVSNTSDDGRFTAMCWYEDMLDKEHEFGYRHSWDPDDQEGHIEDDESTIGRFWKLLSDDELYSEYAISVGKDAEFEFTHLKDHPPGEHGHFWPCSILSKEEPEEGSDDEDRYLVRIFPSEFLYWKNGKETYEDSAVHLLLKNYPRSSIRFMTIAYEGDQFHPKAFHHHIEIKDDIFPEQWKNKG